MPIKHIQKRVDNFSFIQSIYPKFGGVAMGKMAVSPKSGNSYPTETSHFVFSFERGYEDLAPFVNQMYGDKPMSLDVMFIPITNHVDPVERFMPNSMQAWTKSKFEPNKRILTIECDGERVSRLFDYNTKRHVWNPQQGCGYNSEKNECVHGCKPTARLKLALPSLYEAFGVKGYFEMTLHGVESIKNFLVAFKQAGDSIGNFVWRITRTPKTVSYVDPQDGKTKERIYHPIGRVQVLGVYSEKLSHISQPALDVNTSADFDNNNVEDENLQAPRLGLKKAQTQQSLGQLVVEYIHHLGYSNITGEDILLVLGYDTWDDLRENWEGEKTVGAIVSTYLRMTTQAF